MTPYYEDDFATIYHGDAQDDWPVEDRTAACVVFSPPYNVGLDYDEHDDVMSWPDYRHMARAVALSSRDALISGGRCWVNVTPVVPVKPIAAGYHSGRGVNPRVSLIGLWTAALESAGLGIWDYVAWATPRGPGCAWGSWESPSGPNMRGEWETIIAAHRGPWAREHPAEFKGWKDKVGRVGVRPLSPVGACAPEDRVPPRLAAAPERVMSRGVRLEDLPPAMREKAMAALDQPAMKPRKGKTGRAQGGATNGWCWTCGEHFTRVAAWERHCAENEGHRRFELLLDPNQTTEGTRG